MRGRHDRWEEWAALEEERALQGFVDRLLYHLAGAGKIGDAGSPFSPPARSRSVNAGGE